jgi:hypothetical protein
MHCTQESVHVAVCVNFAPNAADRATQCSAVLAALRAGPQRAADIYGLGILAPARRILDLKRAGHRIETQRVGRIGVYVLHEAVQP